MTKRGHRELFEALHGGAGATVPGLPLIEVSNPHPLPETYEQTPEPREIGWGPEYVIDGGAALIFGPGREESNDDAA